MNVLKQFVRLSWNIPDIPVLVGQVPVGERFVTGNYPMKMRKLHSNCPILADQKLEFEAFFEVQVVLNFEVWYLY